MFAEGFMPWSLARTAVVCGVAAVAFTGCLKESGITSSHASGIGNTAAAVVSTPARIALPDFSPLVEAVGPAVVNISVTSVEKVGRSPFGGGNDGDDSDDPFSDLFRQFGFPVPNQGQQQQQRVQQGIGSGFIVSTDGYILTNTHVVEGATEVTVRLTDKREFKAKVIGSDKRTDVALIKITAKDLPTVKIGNPDIAKPGQWVIAMGSPFGLDNTVTAGIISAKSRKLPDETFVPFIQTDVAVNPGNSGGPLINLSGEVIGINSQIYSRSGGYMGISFAIPIDVAMKVKDELQQHGKVSRGKLGVLIQNVDKDLAQSFGLDKAKGALVSSIEPGSPAEKAGLQNGDIIVGVDGSDVDEASDLQRTIGDRHPGDSVKLKVWRDKGTHDFTVKLAEQDDATATVGDDSNQATPGAGLGLAVRPLNAREAQRLGLQSGLVVQRAGGAAAKAGIRQGDVILAVGNHKVTTTDQLQRAVTAAGKVVPLLIQRNDSQQYVVVRLN
jgi:serine protease Do